MRVSQSKYFSVFLLLSLAGDFLSPFLSCVFLLTNQLGCSEWICTQPVNRERTRDDDHEEASAGAICPFQLIYILFHVFLVREISSSSAWLSFHLLHSRLSQSNSHVSVYVQVVSVSGISPVLPPTFSPSERIGNQHEDHREEKERDDRKLMLPFRK